MMLTSFIIGIELAGAIINRTRSRADTRLEEHLICQSRLPDGSVANKNNVTNLLRFELGHENPFVD